MIWPKEPLDPKRRDEDEGLKLAGRLLSRPLPLGPLSESSEDITSGPKFPECRNGCPRASRGTYEGAYTSYSTTVTSRRSKHRPKIAPKERPNVTCEGVSSTIATWINNAASESTLAKVMCEATATCAWRIPSSHPLDLLDGNADSLPVSMALIEANESPLDGETVHVARCLIVNPSSLKVYTQGIVSRYVVHCVHAVHGNECSVLAKLVEHRSEKI